MLSGVEKGIILSLLIQNGYVLDFSNSSFDVFTMQSVGVPIQSQYGLSKGQSLTAYCEEADEADVVKLLHDFLDYYEVNCYDPKKEIAFKKCKSIIDREYMQMPISTPNSDAVDRPYIAEILNKAYRDIDNNEFDSALTKARTAIEEVMIHMVEKKGEEPDKDNINKLYSQVKSLYNMKQDKDLDRRINELLSGLNKTIEAISKMRNDYGDAHGVGSSRINIRDYHARFAVNSASVVVEFLLSVEDYEFDDTKA